MPQIAKGGKYIFGWSVIKEDLSIQLPPMAVEEYGLLASDKVYVMSGSKHTGGFCVSSRELLHNSTIDNVLEDCPHLRDYETEEGELIKYKGRLYCWLYIHSGGILKFPSKTLERFSLTVGDKLLSIRGSDLAFVMGQKGRLIEHAKNYNGIIDEF